MDVSVGAAVSLISALSPLNAGAGQGLGALCLLCWTITEELLDAIMVHLPKTAKLQLTGCVIESSAFARFMTMTTVDELELWGSHDSCDALQTLPLAGLTYFTSACPRAMTLKLDQRMLSADWDAWEDFVLTLDDRRSSDGLPPLIVLHILSHVRGLCFRIPWERPQEIISKVKATRTDLTFKERKNVFGLY